MKSKTTIASLIRSRQQPRFRRPVYAVAGGLSIPAKARSDTIVEEQVCEAVRMMIHDNDLKISSPSDLKYFNGFVQSAYFSDHFEDQLLMSAVVQGAIGWNPDAGWRVEAGGATGGCAMQAAAMAIASGVYDYAIVLGWEKMSMVSTPQATEFIALAADQVFDFSQGGNYTGFYAALANEHIANFGTTRSQMAKVVVKNRNQAQFNPFAQTCHRNPFKTTSGSGFITITDVLQDKRASCSPIRPIDCSQMSDAASALLLCSEELANALSDHPIRLTGAGAGTDTMRTGDRLKERGALLKDGLFIPGRNLLLPHENNDEGVLAHYRNLRYPGGHSFAAGRVAAIKAFEMANISNPLKDIQWFEMHDAFSSAELQAIEDFGLAPFGFGGKFIDTGDWNSTEGRFNANFPSFGTANDRVHINISGGLIGARHGIGDTGVFQNIDTIWRLQGKIKKFYGQDAFQPIVTGGTKAADHSHGGTGSVVAVSIWERPHGLPEYELDPSAISIADAAYQRIHEQRYRLAQGNTIRKPAPPAVQTEVVSPADPDLGFRYKNSAGASIIHTPCTIDYYKTRGRISPFFQGLAEGRCLATYCPDHGVNMPPVGNCRHSDCLEDISENWTDLANEVGSLQTWTVMHYTGPRFKGDLPFVNILVEYPGSRSLIDAFDGRPVPNPVISTSIMSKLVLPEWMEVADIHTGMPVKAAFNRLTPTGNVTDMWFVPAFTRDEWQDSIRFTISEQQRASNSKMF